MLARTKWIYNSLRSEKVLKQLYSDESPFKNFSLVVCGHSLGAGCASLLAIMLRPSFPSIKCFAYEPPGGLIDLNLATKCEDFITATVRQDDIICHTSHQNFEALRDDFFNVLARIKVPKIQAFFDIRTPCTGASIKQRNSKVLAHQSEIPTDTVYYQQLQKFRSERTEADYERLYIPGRIVHLLDPGDGRHHIPYYASKHQFDRIVISKTMVSDHGCSNLVEVLQNAQLSGSGVQGKPMASFRCNNSIVLQEEEEEGNDEEEAETTKIFMLCSNPYGRIPILLTLDVCIAVLCSIVSIVRCDFITRTLSSYLDGDESSSWKFFSVGLFSYQLLDCLDNNCEDPENWTDSSDCVPYNEEYLSVESISKAQIFVVFQIFFAFFSLLLLCISTCYQIGRNTWIVICLVLLLSTLFQGLQFTAFHDICGNFNSDSIESYSVNIACHLGRGASFAIAACCLYFIAAIGSMFFASKK